MFCDGGSASGPDLADRCGSIYRGSRFEVFATFAPMHIGLYFGSFNPVHIGHLIVANHIVENTEVDKVWFVVSPHNPLKEAHSLLNEYDRLHLVELAIENNLKFRASNVEFHLPKPSYTIDTLAYLAEKFPLERFSVIVGSLYRLR